MTEPLQTNESTACPLDSVVMRQPITCDQVAWLLDIADRYLPPQKTPRVCQQRELQKYSMLYEIMDIARLRFSDDSARWNGTPNQARKYDDDGLIKQTTFSDIDDVRKRICTEVIRTKDAQVRECLIKLGWTPPAGT